MPAGLPILKLIDQASEKLGVKLRNRGSKGVTEVQTDAGIWKRDKQTKHGRGAVFFNAAGELARDVRFETWEEADRKADEKAAEFLKPKTKEERERNKIKAELSKRAAKEAATKIARATTLAELEAARDVALEHPGSATEKILPAYDKKRAELLKKEKRAETSRQTMKEAQELRAQKNGENCSTTTAPLMLGSKTSAGLEKVPARYCLVDVYSLQTSNRPLSGFGYTQGYPSDAQERDYFSDKNEQLKVMEIARNFEPALVFNGNPGAIDGMPVVNQDGIVLGGNGRTMAAMIAYSEGDNAQKIRDYLKDNAKLFGFSAKQIQKVQFPFLVRRIKTGRDSAELAAWSRRLNETLSQQLDKTALAVSRAKFLPPQVLQALKIPDDMSVGAWLSSNDSKPFVEGLKSVGVIDARNFKLFIDSQTGLLSADGRDVIIDLIVAVLIPDAQLLKALGPGVTATIARGAPYLAEMKAWGANPFNISAAMVEALRAFVDWRTKGAPIVEYIKQAGLFGAQRSKLVNLWLKIVHDLGSSPVRFMKLCRFYVQEARGPAMGQVALFSAETRTPYQILASAAQIEGVTDLSSL